MNKIEYIKPEVEILAIDTVEMLALSLVEDEEVDTSEDGVQLIQQRRGRWGNLWYKGDE